MLPAIDPTLARYAGRAVCVVATGDPLHYGIGALLGEDITVLPHPSSVSLACARLRWPVEQVEVVSAVGRPVAALAAALHPGRRVLVLSAGSDTPAQVRALLAERGYGASEVTVLEELGGPGERIGHEGPYAALNLVAVRCVADADTRALGLGVGLPDDAYEHDGQITKREVRAVTLSALAPVPGELLWDVGAGSGSVGIEWMRSHRSCRAVAIEASVQRAERIARNASTLGVPGLQVVHGVAPAALAGLLAPDAVFVGGGLTGDGVLDTCWSALRVGGRLVANAVTVESEAVLVSWRSRVGGELTRIAINRSSPVGGFTGWRPLMPVTQWSVRKSVRKEEGS
jgi:precorrin-6Y C5,15-methyltransferase (decarboxylating)